jgi:hypothetical protein
MQENSPGDSATGSGREETELKERLAAARRRLLAEQLISDDPQRPGESDDLYRRRLAQADTLVVLLANGEVEIPEYSEADKLEAQENARVYYENRARARGGVRDD